MSTHARILFLGVDAASGSLIESWAASGILPTFRALMARGLVGRTESVDGFFVGSTWPSFYTGASPARHGIHSLVQLRPGTYELYRCYTGDFVKREPFWNHLSRAGRRVAICDVPLTGVSTGLNGIQMVEWGSHDANYGFRTWPPSLATEVEARFGVHPQRDSCDGERRSAAEFVDFTRRLVDGVRRKAALTRHYLRHDEWDFFAQVFTESHCVGHQCWHLHDPGYPGWEAAWSAEAGDPIRDVYVAIDEAIADILGDVGNETLVVVLASHGMSHRYGAQFLLSEVLARLGVAAPRPMHGERPGPIARALGWGWARTPEVARRPIRLVRDRIRARGDSGSPALPRESPDGRCFVVDNGLTVGGIRFNLAGREPRGMLEPRAAPEFCRQLTGDLRDIVDADSGRPIVARVLRTADLYTGEHLHDLPDLLVAWSDERPLGSTTVGSGRGARVRLTSGKIGAVEGDNRYCRSGDHRREGLFVAIGSAVSPARMSRTVSIMDFAPTFTRLLGVDLTDADGGLISELLAGG